MNQRKTFLFAGTVGIGIVIFSIFSNLGSTQPLNAAAPCKFVPRSLRGASLDELEKAAQDFACTWFEITGDAPQPVMKRFVTAGDLVSMFNEGRSDVGCPDQQLGLVILKGDMKQKNGAFPGYTDFRNSPHLGYIALVFDLEQGSPRAYFGSLHGENFRAILNDPTIPTEVPAPVQSSSHQLVPGPALPKPNATRSCSNGTPAPPLVPPITSTPLLTPTRPPYP